MFAALVTVLTSSDPVELAAAESALRSAGIPYATRNQGVQNLIGIGQIGGRNLATGHPEIQVAEADVDRARSILRSMLEEVVSSQGQANDEVDDEPAVDREERDVAIRHARYSAGWAVLSLFFDPFGIFPLIAIYFGLHSARRWRRLPTSQKWLTITGLVLAPLLLLFYVVDLLFGPWI